MFQGDMFIYSGSIFASFRLCSGRNQGADAIQIFEFVISCCFLGDYGSTREEKILAEVVFESF